MATGLIGGVRSPELSIVPGRVQEYLEDLGSRFVTQGPTSTSKSALKRKRGVPPSPSGSQRSSSPHAHADETGLHSPESSSQASTARPVKKSQADDRAARRQRNGSVSSRSSNHSWQSDKASPQTSLTTSGHSPAINMPPKQPSQFRGTHIGASVDLEPLLLDLAPGHSTHTGEIYQNFSGTPFLLRRRDSQQSQRPNLESISRLEQLVGSFGSDLVDAYLSNIHFNFPVVGADFFQLYKSGRKNLLSSVLTAAVYTVATPWLSERITEKFATSVNVEALEQLAFNSLSHALSNPDLSSIQAGLLLMQRPNVDSKALNSQLVAAAYELGLQVDCSSWDIGVAEIGLRKRLAWALYIQDKWCALIHGRPSAISSSNWVVKNLTEQDFDTIMLDGQPADSSGYTLYMEMVALTEILSLVLDTFYTLKAIEEVNEAGSNGTRLVLDRAKPTQLKLKEWFSALPAELKMDAGAKERPISIGYLHLAYFATEITLHRCIIRSLQSSGGESYMKHICRSAAKTRLISAMDFVNRLRRDHLEGFWYFPSRNSFALIGTFGSLLLATAPGQEEADFYNIRLSEYRWTLAVSSKSAPFLALAVESLDNTTQLLEKLPQKPRTSEMVDHGEGTFQTTSWSGSSIRDIPEDEDEDDEDDDDDDEDEEEGEEYDEE